MKLILKILGLSIFLVIAAYVISQGTFNKSLNSSDPKLEIFSDDKGKAALSIGNCASDSECKPTGCSSQICANHEVVTTCELGVFPERKTYSCGCKNSKCVWYRYR